MRSASSGVKLAARLRGDVDAEPVGDVGHEVGDLARILAKYHGFARAAGVFNHGRFKPRRR